jgi:hypothetical protein
MSDIKRNGRNAGFTVVELMFAVGGVGVIALAVGIVCVGIHFLAKVW